jgi:hypothetical protein
VRTSAGVGGDAATRLEERRAEGRVMAPHERRRHRSDVVTRSSRTSVARSLPAAHDAPHAEGAAHQVDLERHRDLVFVVALHPPAPRERCRPPRARRSARRGRWSRCRRSAAAPASRPGSRRGTLVSAGPDQGGAAAGGAGGHGLRQSTSTSLALWRNSTMSAPRCGSHRRRADARFSSTTTSDRRRAPERPAATVVAAPRPLPGVEVHRLHLGRRTSISTRAPSASARDLHGGLGRRVAPKMADVHLVHRGPVGQVDEEDGHLHDPIERRAGRRQDHLERSGRCARSGCRRRRRRARPLVGSMPIWPATYTVEPLMAWPGCSSGSGAGSSGDRCAA